MRPPEKKRERARTRQQPDPEYPLRIAVLLAAVLPAVMILFQVTGFNGPSYWQWRYVPEAFDAHLVFAAAAGGLAFWAARRQQAGGRHRSTILLLMATQAVLLISFVAVSEQGLDAIPNRVRHPDITSYYTEAAKLRGVGGFLRDYDRRLPAMQGHTQTHPPGAILYFYAWQRLAGESAPFWSGWMLVLALTLGVPLIYSLTERLTGDREPALLAGAMWTALPGLVTIAPSFDPLYAVFTLALVYTWTLATSHESPAWAAAWGAAWFVALCFTHSFLTLGLFFLLSAPPRRAAVSGAIGGAVLAGCFGAVWALTGYNHLAALRASMRIQGELAQVWHRPYNRTVFWDLYDFSLAAGWLPAAVVVAAVIGWKRRWPGLPPAARALVPAGLATILAVDLTGLLRAETARVWLFLQPFLIVPAALELRSWPSAWRHAAFGVLLFALAAIGSRLAFI